MRREKAIFRPNPFGLSAAKIASFFAELLAILGERPCETVLEVELPEAGVFSLDLFEGEAHVVDAAGGKARIEGSRKYIADHPVPLKFRERTRFVLSPASGDRVRARKA